MQIKITNVARTELDRFDEDTRSKVLEAVRAIPTSIASDKVLRLSGVDEEIRVRRVSDRLRALYRVTDVDEDGEDEVVLLQIVDRHVAEPIAEAHRALIDGEPEQVRLGRELAAEIATAD